jgi:hypothetical protein
MLAVLDLIEPLAGPDFRIWRQTRTGLLSYPLDPAVARAHLAASVYLQMALKPHIIHIVGHTEADHAATAEDVIEACKIARRAIENALQGAPDMTADPKVIERREELVAEAGMTLQKIKSLPGPGVTDPLADPTILARAVISGILDAPQLQNNLYGLGRVQTMIIDGKCLAVNESRKPLHETERLTRVVL